jgi:hypothetical protein
LAKLTKETTFCRGILSAKFLQNVTESTALIHKTVNVNFMLLLTKGNTDLRVSETMQNVLGYWSRLVNTELLGANWMGGRPVDTGPSVVAAVCTARRFQSIDLFVLEMSVFGFTE